MVPTNKPLLMTFWSMDGKFWNASGGRNMIPHPIKIAIPMMAVFFLFISAARFRMASPTSWTKVAVNAALAIGDGMLEMKEMMGGKNEIRIKTMEAKINGIFLF